jgi:hypothetical protein
VSFPSTVVDRRQADAVARADFADDFLVALATLPMPTGFPGTSLPFDWAIRPSRASISGAPA